MHKWIIDEKKAALKSYGIVTMNWVQWLKYDPVASWSDDRILSKMAGWKENFSVPDISLDSEHELLKLMHFDMAADFVDL